MRVKSIIFYSATWSLGCLCMLRFVSLPVQPIFCPPTIYYGKVMRKLASERGNPITRIFCPTEKITAGPHLASAFCFAFPLLFLSFSAKFSSRAVSSSYSSVLSS